MKFCKSKMISYCHLNIPKNTKKLRKQLPQILKVSNIQPWNLDVFSLGHNKAMNLMWNVTLARDSWLLFFLTRSIVSIHNDILNNVNCGIE